MMQRYGIDTGTGDRRSFGNSNRSDTTMFDSVTDIDSLYVPIGKAHSAVISAIEHPQGPHLILLHGGVGKGKSTLARFMMQRYGIDTGTGDRRSFGNSNRSDTTVFDRVVWVSCGNCSTNEISAKQLEILQNHSPNSLGDSSPEEKTNLKPRIAKALQDFFSNKNVLVILDDITDERFLHAMWEAITGGKRSTGGKGVKILVTSQWRNICAKAGLRNVSCSIFMEDPTEDEAMKILASLVGLEGKCIPHHLQHTAKKMVKVTEKNPLALACLASHFAYSKDFEDQQAWQDALKGLRKLLDSPEERLVLPIGVSGKHAHPRSLCGAMKICIDSLRTEDAQKILFLMYAFKEETTPELVLRILHGSLKRSNCTFSKSRDELAMRELLKIHQNPEQTTSVYLRSLVKLYMQQTMMVGGKEIKSLIDELVHDIEQALQSPESSNAEIQQEGETDKDGQEKERVALTLCALYFDLHDAGINKIVIDAMTRANITFTNDGSNDLRRQAIYPILSLMDMLEDEHGKKVDVWSARQVFLSFICKHELDDKNISHLLEGTASTTTQLATLKAVGNILFIEKGPSLKENNLNFLQALVQLLDVKRGLPTSLLEEASRTLHSVCWKASNDQSRSLITNSPGVLDVLVSLISIPIQCPAAVAEHAALALWNLAYCPNSENTVARIKILRKEGVLVNLAKCLSEHDKPGLQRGAAGAVASLCGSKDTSLKLRIANQEGLLQSLVKLMSSHETPANVQKEATRALQNLAAGEDEDLMLRIVNEETALEGLARLLSMHDKPDTQQHATQALANLAWSADISVKIRIANQKGLLQSLVKLMSSHETPANVQKEATRALQNLAAGEDEDLMLRIVNEETALEGLARLLSMHDKPDTQQHATQALANLAWSADISVKIRIANQKGLLQSLVKLMSSHETPANVQKEATRALQNLAAGEDEDLMLRIVNEETALEGLARLLHIPEMQKQAAAALRNLSIGDVSIKELLVIQDGVVASLVAAMSKEHIPEVQKYAAMALRNLSTADASTRKLLVTCEGVVASLVAAMSKEHIPEVQKLAAMALCNLCAGDTLAKELLVTHDGVVAGLVATMSNEHIPEMQKQAAMALCNLIAGDASTRQLLMSDDRVVAGLGAAMFNLHMPEVQKQAAMALFNLPVKASMTERFTFRERDRDRYEDLYEKGGTVMTGGTIWQPVQSKSTILLTEMVEGFIKEINAGRDSGYFVSKPWMLSLDEHQNEELMSVLWQAGYLEIYQTDTTVFYEKVDEAVQVLKLYNDPQNHDFGGRDTSMVLASIDSGAEDKIEEEIYYTEKYTDQFHLASQMNRSDFVDPTVSTGSFKNDMQSASVQIDQTTALDSSKSRLDKGKMPLTTSNEMLESFKKAIKYTSLNNFCVSTQWLSNLSEQEKENLNFALLKAGYLKIDRTSTTTYYEKLQGHVRNDPNHEIGRSSIGQKSSIVGGVQSGRAFHGHGDLLADDQQLLNIDDEGSSLVTTTIQESHKREVICPCPPLHLTVSCTPEPSTSSSSQGEYTSKYSTRKAVGDSYVTMPKKLQGQLMRTGADKEISMKTVSFGGGNDFNNVSLKVSAYTSLTCCLTSEPDDKKVRIEFSTIGGEVQIEENDGNAKTNTVVLRSVRSNVNACIIHNDETDPSEPISLYVQESEDHCGWQRVLQTYKLVDENGQSKGQDDLVWMELSGNHPKNSERGSTTLELQCHVRNRVRYDLEKGCNNAHVLHFTHGHPVILEGNIFEDLKSNMLLELNVRYQVVISYNEPRLPKIGQKFVATTRVDKITDFDCVLEFRTRKFSSLQSNARAMESIHVSGLV